MATIVSKTSAALKGVVRLPGDKSISHRALILSALATGNSRIKGLLEAEDVLNTIGALRLLGVICDKKGQDWVIKGHGLGAFRAPEGALDFGNSGTGARLMIGALAAQPIEVSLTGDESLKKRPMGRILKPLLRIGAKVFPKDAAALPLTLTGTAEPVAITYRLPVPSAQVKSALLLAALNIPGETCVIEETPTRDHTERLLAQFGVPVKKETLPGGGVALTIKGRRELKATDVSIPGDFSAAAFLLAATLMVPGSRLEIKGVGLNRLRTGLLDVLGQMGADIRVSENSTKATEPYGGLAVNFTQLSAVETDPAMAARMIDEFPVLFALAALADGVSSFRGLAELRLKESDRLRQMAKGLEACGVEVKEFDDGLAITGRAGKVPGGAVIDASGDHRVAMAFAVLGLRADKPVTIKGTESISTSFPGFAKLMHRLGANIEETFE
ncbi:MAG: 3-phosphoshikimate 1-carboxyvinyltransferase [Proteobacteria bacterium]|nr:3-phosphoshikimate 1-carboxyvinyltransferase [Pseudomonadota bacterium]